MNPIGGVMDVAIDYQKMVKADQKVRRCQACMTVFGVEYPDGSALDTGLVVATVIKGNCRKCGFPISWYATDRYIERIKKACR